jgi:TolB-like protein/Tfp pilus assembly protein PilF
VAEGDGEEQTTDDAPAMPSALRRHGGSTDVFISYASADKRAADSICAALERGGIVCWIAPRDVTPGVFYADAIVEAINSAHILVVVLSTNSVGSQHVLREVERASAKRRPLVAFRLDTTPLPTGLEYFLSASHWLDASGGTIERALPGLVDAVHRLLGSSDKPVADTSLHNDSTVNAGGGVTSARTSAPKPRWNRLWIAATVVVVVLLAVLVGKFWPAMHVAREQPTTAGTNVVSDKSIAVLPFTDMSEKKDQEYFADGMAEEILDLLAKLPGIRVIGRTSSFQFKGKTEDLRTIGRTLGAAYVVEGSVRKSGDRIRITAQLINSDDGSHVWSDTYDEASGDVLKVQDRIATNLVRALQVTVGADDLQSRPPLKRTEAYDLYLRGRYAFDRFDRSGFEAAAGHFQQALDLDPSLTCAADWLANTLENLAEWGYVQPVEGFERARSAAQRALTLNSRSTMAHATLTAINLIYDWDWTSAKRESEHALALGPHDSQAIGVAGMVQSALGRWDEGARFLGAAMAIDPLFAGWHEILGNIRFREGRYSEAEAELRKTLQISPTYASGHYYLGQILMFEGKLEEALGEMQQEAPDSGRDSGLASVYHAMGRKADSDAALARVTKERAGDVAYEIAQAHAYRGEADQAFAWLDRAYDRKDIELYWIKGDRLLKNLEGDPRYKAFLGKMNLPE